MRNSRLFLWLLSVVVIATIAFLAGRSQSPVSAALTPAAPPVIATSMPQPSPAATTTGNLVIHIQPTNTTVTIAGVTIPTTSGPAARNEKLGHYPVAVTADGFDAWHGDAIVQATPSTRLEVTLRRAYGNLRLDIRPFGLGYALKGAEFSTEGVISSQPVHVPAGRYVLTVFGDRTMGVLREMPVEVNGDDTAHVDVDLQPEVSYAIAQHVDKAILNNARQLAAASDQYFLENGVSTVAAQNLIGPTNYVRALNLVAGETYPQHFTQGVTLTVTGVAGGRTITYAP
jgi:hypothetical protein